LNVEVIADGAERETLSTVRDVLGEALGEALMPALGEALVKADILSGWRVIALMEGKGGWGGGGC
jgi:hypothetical protein